MSYQEQLKGLQKEEHPFAHLKEKVKEIQEIKVPEVKKTNPKTRVVTLRFKLFASCGCGGGKGGDIKREVPWDSPLQDGDTVADLKVGDRPA